VARMEPTDGPLVAIVDDDESDDRSSGSLRSGGFRSDMFASAEYLLERGDLGRTG